MNDRDFEWFEKKNNVNLPSEFKKAVQKSSSIEGKLFSNGEDGSSVLREIFSFSGGSQSRVSKVWRGVIEDIPKGVMPFGYDSGDNFVCLDLTSGAIYWIDHETMEPIRISESISEFIQTMTEPEPPSMGLVEKLGKEGSAEEVRKFLRIEKTNKLSNGGRSLAQEASRYGNLDALQVCFKEGENLSGCIQLAAMNCHFNVVRFLVEQARVDVNERSKEGWSPIQCAINDSQIKQFLRSYGAK